MIFRLRFSVFAFVFLLCWLAVRPPLAGAQVSPSEALGMMKTAEGIEVTLFASEPEVLNPVGMAVDERGRVWITEAVNYRIFQNPRVRPEGDRIRVLEDTDGDGKCDKATTFYQDASLQAPLSIAVLGSRVYVCQSPDVFYLEDTNGDGVADKKTVILTGFKGKDHDHAIHGINFGPDGRLYMSNGDQGLDVSDKQGNRVRVGRGAPHMAGSVLRADLDGNKLELLAEGLRNPMEPAEDSFGNVFISDNDDDGNEECRIVHVMEGANYGYWPQRKGDRHLDEIHWNEDVPGVMPKILRTGFGSPVGMIFYEGSEMLPQVARRALIHADAGPGVVRAYPLKAAGASYSAKIEILLSCPEDKWFRPVDVAAAPDGSVFVADWYDPGVGGHNLRDWTRGRIYRLAPPMSPYAIKPELVNNPEAAARALGSPNQSVRFLAFQAIRQDASPAAETALKALAGGSDPVSRARALWLCGERGAAGHDALMKAAQDPDPEFRALAVRIAVSHGVETLQQGEWLLRDRDAMVRRELLLSLQHATGAWAEDWILALAGQFDGRDRYYRECVGIAMRGREESFYPKLKELFEKSEGNSWSRPFVELALQLHTPEAAEMAAKVLADAGRPVSDRLDAIRILAAASGEKSVNAMIGQLQPGATDAASREIAEAILKTLAMDPSGIWEIARKNSDLKAYLKFAIQDARPRASAEGLVREARMVEFIPALMEIAGDRAQPISGRLAAIETAAQLQSVMALEGLKGLLDDPDPSIAEAAARGIAGMNQDAATEVLRAVLMDADRTPAMRKFVVRVLGASKSGALLLLRLAEAGELKADLTLDAATVTHASPHEDIRLMADQLLPLEQSREGKALPPIAELIKMQGDAGRGRGTFYRENDGPQCFRCHKIEGNGRDVGPDLSKIGSKSAKEALFESILNPSAAISHEYQVWLIRSKTKGYLNGYIRTESEKGIELVDANGSTTKLGAKDILERDKSAVSLMPSGLSGGMTTQQLVDLVEYLSGLK